MEEEEIGKKQNKKHKIRPAWLRITLKTLMWIVIVVLCIPVLLYIPPIQRLVIDVAEKVVKDSTGMEISVGQFRLKFPLDVSLRDVYVLTTERDTMASVGEAIADVKLLPLLQLDLKVNKLTLDEGYYRMVSPDSSMIMSIRAGHLEVDSRSSVNIGKSEINLNKVYLRDGALSLLMDVWKQKDEPQDTTASTPFLIRANDVKLENFGFGMSMLPTIDTLDMAVKRVELKRGVVDLRKNLVSWSLASVSDGTVEYIQPTAEWVKAHPAPPSKPSSGPPMRIMGDSIALSGLQALYATKGARPAAGFDPAYISVSGIEIGMRDFYNEASTVKLPITKLQAKERSGLQITQGRGLIAIDSIGMKLADVNLKTLFSQIGATADVPFAMMAMDPQSAMSVNAGGHIGMPDIEAFMPAVKEYTAKVPARKPLYFDINGEGSLADLVIRRLQASMAGVVSIEAQGNVANVLDYKRLRARLGFKGALMDPSLADKFLPPGEMKIPAFDIKGTAEANGLAYGADIDLRTTAGDLVARGKVALTPETYTIDAGLHEINVAQFMPSLGIGSVSGEIAATGAGFNPVSGKATTDARVYISEIEYNKQSLTDIRVDAQLLGDGALALKASSMNPGLNLDVEGVGVIKTDDYTVDLLADIRDLNLWQLGLSDSVSNGHGVIKVSGTASPARWLYDVRAEVSDFEWNLPDAVYDVPEGLHAYVKATEYETKADINSLLTSIVFESPMPLKPLIDALSVTADTVMTQLKVRNIAVDAIRRNMPLFSLKMNASGRGVLSKFLEPSGIMFDTIWANIGRDSLLHGNINLHSLTAGGFKLDTIGLKLAERGQLLDYRIHVGNRPGTFDEFAQVNLNGYVGSNRMGAYLNQQNLKGETGYRLGLTAAMMDSTVSVHFTPLKATIAYMPWTMNSDNYIDMDLYTYRVDANLTAMSNESSIMAKTEPTENGGKELHLRISNLHIEDFLQMSWSAPPIEGDVNTDLRVNYDNNWLQGGGVVKLNGLRYDKILLGDFDLDLDAGYSMAGGNNTDVRAALRIDGKQAMNATARLGTGADGGLKADSIGLALTRFPLRIANAFLGNNLKLAGYLNGKMEMEGSFTEPMLNGSIAMDSVTAGIPMAGATLRFDTVPLVVDDNIIKFNAFDIWAANENPLTIIGRVDASKFSDIAFDMAAKASNMQLVNSDIRSKADLYGKVFVNLNAKVRGPMKRMAIDADVNILGTTDATYRLNMTGSELQVRESSDVVKFVNFNDTTQTAEADTIVESPLNMKIEANLRISPGAKLQVMLSGKGTDKVQVSPTANLNYSQNYMGDMALNGKVTLGQGMARYAVPVLGEKEFSFDPNSTITWNGNVMNPTLNVTATDQMKANVTTGGNSRLVNFIVTLHATDQLDKMKVSFDLGTNDDLTIQNELQSMSSDQRQTQAMNMLLYGQYVGQGGTKANAKLDGNMLYSFLESQLNSWAAKNIRGVELSFGINQYDKSINGSKTTTTSYSYQVSKSLFNNRFKINVGGNYSTDASAEDNLAQNLISDISFEYILKQTQTINMSVELFRHQGFESILEGEITETGVGFVMKRKLDNLKSLFRFRRRKKKQEPSPSDSVPAAATVTTDSSDAYSAKIATGKKEK